MRSDLIGMEINFIENNIPFSNYFCFFFFLLDFLFREIVSLS